MNSTIMINVRVNTHPIHTKEILIGADDFFCVASGIDLVLCSRRYDLAFTLKKII